MVPCWVVAELDLQGLLAAAVCAEARQGPIQSCQLEQALHHAKFLPQRLAKQVLAGVGGTAKDWSASADLTGWQVLHFTFESAIRFAKRALIYIAFLTCA